MAMDDFDSYDLGTVHKIRYFWPAPDPVKLLKRVRKWIKANDVEVVDININNKFEEEDEDIVWEATVIYLGGTY